jgi:hypothetical protein
MASTETTATETSNVVDLPPPAVETKTEEKKATTTKPKAHANGAKKKSPVKAKAPKTKSKPAKAKAKTASAVKKVAKAVKEKVKKIAGTKAQAQVGKDLFKYAQSQAKAQSTKDKKVRVAEVIRGYIYAGARKDGFKEAGAQ